jgi:putative hydrolase of the HAD superfamily
VQNSKLKSCKLEHYFSHIVFSEAAHALKPDKQIFEYALQLNHATPDVTIMIGDSFEADICGAQNAGIDQIFFNINNEVSEKFNSATYQVHRLEEILEII